MSSLQGHLWKEHEGDSHGHWEMGNRQQQSQTLETQLILRVGAKRAETKAFCREETFSTERKPRGDISGGGIFICIHCSQDCHSCWWWWGICCGCTSHDGCCIAVGKWSITVWVQIQGFYRPTDATHTCIRLVETYCILYMSVVLHSFRHF